MASNGRKRNPAGAIVALLVIPTAVVSGVKPEETIRYE